MNKLNLVLPRTGFRPREMLHGVAEWQLERAPTAIEVRLCWFVQVQGIVEMRCVQTIRFDRPAEAEKRDFEFHLPDAPYSFAGSLATLGWAIELVALPETQFAQAFFNLAPHATVVWLRTQLQPAIGR